MFLGLVFDVERVETDSQLDGVEKNSRKKETWGLSGRDV